MMASAVVICSSASSSRPRRRVRTVFARGRSFRRARDADQTEVTDARAPVAADEHVVGLEVAVHHAGGMRGLQPTAGADEHAHDLAPIARRRGSPGRQGLPVDVFHGDEELLADGADVVHGDYVRVREPCHGLRFALQPRAAFLLAHPRERARAEELERHASIEERIVGGEHHAHAAAAEQPHHDEAAEGSERRRAVARRRTVGDLGQRRSQRGAVVDRVLHLRGRGMPCCVSL
jgi:hypothetical protein